MKPEDGSKRFKRKNRILLLVLSLLLTAGTVPVSAEGENGEAAAEEIVMEFWQPDIWDYTPALQAYVDAIDYPLTINIESVPLGDFSAKLKVAMAAGDAPDLLLLPNWLIPEFTRFDGLFADLNKLDAAATAELKRSLTPGVWGTVNPPARQAVSFVPLNSAPSVWIYRTDLFRQAGLPSDPTTVASKFKTWNAVDAVGKTFAAKTKRTLFGDPSAVFEATLVQKSPVYYDAKGAYIGDKNPQIKKAYDRVVKGFKEGWIGRYQWGSDAYDKAFKAGSFASFIGDQATMDDIKSRLPATSGKWAVAPLPESTTDGGILSGTVPAGSSQPDIAFDILRFLTEEEMQNWAYNELGFFPAGLNALAEEAWLNEKDPFFGNQQVNRMLVQAVKTAKPYPLYAERYPAPAAYNRAIDELIRNAKADPAAVWATAVKKAKTEAAAYR